MKRLIGTQAHGIRLPIISRGDDLARIVADNVLAAATAEGIRLCASDIIGITEAIVAKAQGNYVNITDIAADIRRKYSCDEIGLVFPILSRNRFLNILKGISLGVKKVHLLLQYPSDEVGNPIMDADLIDDLEDKLDSQRPITAANFKELAGTYPHPFTGIDYISLYQDAAPNISVYLSNDPRDILRLTKNILVCEIHARTRTKKRLLRAGADLVYTLTDICAEPVSDGGFNPDYGVLGSNVSGDDSLKLFPRDCASFIDDVRGKILKAAGVAPEIMIYGDGAFKDPERGIWELADPVVSPAYTEKLAGQPNEIKLKYVAEGMDGDNDHKRQAVTEMIKSKKTLEHSLNESLNKGLNEGLNEGTTPRKYADLLGSLCDLMSGSGDKGTPVVLVRGYFDDYSDE